MKNKEKFINFLESLKTDESKALIDSVAKGFNSLFEEEIPVTTSNLEVFSKDEIASMGEKTLKNFAQKGKIGFGKSAEEAAQVLKSKYDVEPYGTIKVPSGFIAFYNGSE